MSREAKEAAAQAVRDLYHPNAPDIPATDTWLKSGASAALTRREQHRTLGRA